MLTELLSHLTSKIPSLSVNEKNSLPASPALATSESGPEPLAQNMKEQPESEVDSLASALAKAEAHSRQLEEQLKQKEEQIGHLTQQLLETKQSLVDSIAREAQLSEQLAESQKELEKSQTNCAELNSQLSEKQKELEESQARQAQSEAQLNEIKQAPFKPKRRRKKKSAPSDEQAKKPKKRGRPPGHEGSGRTVPEDVDEVVKWPVGDHCPDCDSWLEGPPQVRERTVEDIVPQRATIVTRYEIERRWCPKCSQYKERPLPVALPNHRLGLNFALFVVYQKVALGLSYGKIQQELAIYFGLRVTQATLAATVAKVSRLFGPAYARLIRLMRQQKVIHIDETSWKIEGVTHWLWIFINDLISLYVLSPSRGSKVPKALLGQDFKGIIVSDFYSAYSPLDVQKAKCWAHLLRDSHELTKGRSPPDSERVIFHQDLHYLYIEMGLALEEVEADPSLRAELHQEMEQKLLSFAERDWQDADCKRLAKRVKKYLSDLLLWLLEPEVKPDNNAAERGLRPAVIVRKTSGGSRSKQGAQAFARLRSLIRSWESAGQDFFSAAKDFLNPQPMPELA